MNHHLKRYLENTLQGPEFDLFADLFHRLPKERFALIKVSGATLAGHLDSLAEDIALLNELELYPILVHGAGTELDKALPGSRKVEGVRVTTSEDMQVIERVFAKLNHRLCLAIEAKGGSAEPVADLFQCRRLEGYGQVGVVEEVALERLVSVVRAGKTPVISPLGYCGGQTVNLNADTAAKAVVQRVLPKKFVILTPTGGILDAHGKVIPYMDLSREPGEGLLSGGMLHKVREVREFLAGVPGCSVSITSADKLLAELFTVKGSGTYLKYHQLRWTDHLGQSLKKKLRALLENAFGKQLVPGYFKGGFLEVIYQKDLEGAAVVRTVGGLPYLDKFAVAKPYQGTGLGASLWAAVTERYEQLLWRAAPDNPLNAFYAKHCSGMLRSPRWMVYWLNLDPHEALAAAGRIDDLEATLIPGGS